MEKLQELAFFEDLLKTSKNSLVEQAVNEGKIAVGYNCSMVPEPLLNVDGLFPVCLRAPEVIDTESANFYMSPFNCSYSRSILQNGIDGNYDFLGGLVFASSCIHIHRVEHNFEIAGINNNKEGFLSYVIDMPWKSFPAGMDTLTGSLRKLGGKLAEAYGADASDRSVTKAIKRYNQFVRLLKEIGDLRLQEHPVITGTEWHTVYAASKVAPKDMLIEPLKDLKSALEKREPIANDFPRVMVMGSHFDNPAFTELIESQGCVVVADRYCFGSLPGLELIPEEGDPYRNLAEHYVGISECPRMMAESQKRLDHMFHWIEEYKVDGLIFEVMKFCDLWGWEALKTEQAAKAYGIPFVKFEREYQLTGEGQMKTRIQAFIESIQNKKLDAVLKG